MTDYKHRKVNYPLPLIEIAWRVMGSLGLAMTLVMLIILGVWK
jgi:hypothetical protein